MYSQHNWTATEVATFVLELRRVISWTQRLAANFDPIHQSYGRVFRQTNPEIGGTKLYTFEENGGYRCDTDKYYPDHLREMLQLAKNARPHYATEDLKELLKQGRILSFETCNTTCDGAAEHESKTFFDLGDTPPIDTWFFLKNKYMHADHLCTQALFCWIPKAFESVVQAGIDVEVYESYRWLDENDPYMYYTIQSAC
ncbi:hypothetical protein QNI16_31230 [Cytophagaceae bacterium YF14B1]|uniref:Uncharacterized protein n=1 Tax=Xanthocytophaga flava TaxID=3048013 RepID=A0AAE3UCN8_9BACT|nr:hypothetical protein [Xanthocytophaga flavus]MDJ1485014.1 hypothetical protein [Xanthocytophaga flavus]